jgi:hypothetical protein
MNATRVFNSAVRRPGILLTIFLLLVLVHPMRAAEITATVTGVLTGGWDQMGMFFTGNEAKNLGGKPFTLVFTFDDAKGKPEAGGNCPRGVSGEGPQSPGKAVLTMGNGSYTFGDAGKFSTSGIYRECGGGLLSMSISERKGSFFNDAPQVDVRIVPGNGSRSLPHGSDWRSPMSTTGVDNQSSCFIILRRMNSPEVRGCFDVKKVEVTKR